MVRVGRQRRDHRLRLPFSWLAALVAFVVAAWTTPAAAAGSQCWGGYMVAGADTSISAELVVPWPACGAGPAAVAVWVGIDDRPTVEQDGVTVHCSGGRPGVNAWYEAWPAPAVGISLPVRFGDHLRLIVYRERSGWGGFYIKNLTTGRAWAKSVPTPGAAWATAECVAEYVGVPIPIRLAYWDSCVTGRQSIPGDPGLVWVMGAGGYSSRSSTNGVAFVTRFT